MKPNTGITPMPFQIEGARFLASRATAMLGDDMGLGKTYQAMMAVETVVNSQSVDRKHPFNVLIICPAFLAPQWREEVSIHMSAATGFDIRFYIVSYNIATSNTKGVLDDLYNRIDILILDEAHYVKGIDSKRTAAILKRGGIAHYAKRIWCLTGTPLMNRPVELYPILKSLAPANLREYSDYYDYTRRYCLGKQGKFGWEAKGCAHTEELSQMLKGFMLRRMKRDVLDLPPVIYERIHVEPDPGMMTQILFEQEILDADRLAAGEVPEIGSMSTLRKLIGLSKRDCIVEHVQNVLSSRNNVCVFAWHTDLIEYIASKFENTAVVMGGMSVEKKTEVKKQFMKGETQVFIGQLKAAGEGVNGLQEVCDHMIIAEPDWSPKTMEQATGRLDRMGQKGERVLVQTLIAGGTLEDTIMRVQRNKNQNIERILQ